MVEKQKRQRKRRWIVIALVLALVILAMVIPVAYVMSKKNKDDPQPTGRTRGSGAGRNTTQTDELRLKQYSNTSSALNPMGLLFTPTRGVQEGANGSTVYTYVDGVETNFTYVNEFGGDFSWDPSLGIMGKGGKAQSWSPRVGEEWDWNTDLVRGVNLGGWLVTEPFIVPHLYQGAYAGALDEKELSAMMRNKSNTTLELVMREHYETFITEQDFAQIAQAGLNYVRIPLGFWAVEKLPEEPFLESVSWEYFVRSLHWARKYGIRVILDLHALPGAQTPWNHAMGAKGVVNWLYGVAGILNAQRTLETVRSLTQFISQDGYKDVVTMISLVNEVEASRQGFNTLLSL
jgi:glucan 1,3-beta-glucosidase